MTKIKLLIGGSLVVALVALGVGHLSFKNQLLPLATVLAHLIFWSTHYGQSLYLITG